MSPRGPRDRGRGRANERGAGECGAYTSDEISAEHGAGIDAGAGSSETYGLNNSLARHARAGQLLG
jgi:hypothetical protein